MKNVYTVFDSMQKQVVTIAETATFKEAVKKMIYAKTNGLVVTNEREEIKGILSSWDLIKHLVDDKYATVVESDENLERRINAIADDPIMKFVTTRVVTVNQNDPLLKAARLLAEFNIRQLPVVDDDQKLVGYINRTDLKKAVGEILGIPFIY